MKKIRVLIVDDDVMMLEALHAFVGLADDLEVVGEAHNGQVAVAQARALHPDVVLMDMQMPVMDGVEAIARIRAEMPHVGLLALTTFSSERYVVPSLQAGASGYLVKDTSPEEIAATVRLVHAGESHVDPRVVKHVVRRVADDRRPPVPREVPALSEREVEVVGLLATGLSNREIAEQMVVSESTVKSHIARLSAKLGVRDRVQVVIRAHQWGLAELKLAE